MTEKDAVKCRHFGRRDLIAVRVEAELDSAWRNSYWNEFMDSRLLDILVCPICKGPLVYRRAQAEFVCKADRLAFPIRDDIR